MSATESGRSRLGRAWLAAAMVPVGALAGLLLAYVVEGLIDPDTVGDERSLVVDLVSLVLIAACLAVPALGAWRWGRAVELDGDARGRVPRLTGCVVAGLLLLGVVVQLVVNAADGRY